METPRLILREETEELLEQVEQFSEEEQLLFFGVTTPSELLKHWGKIRKRRANKGIGWRKWHIVSKEDGQVIGGCGFHNWLVDHDKAELGYALNESHHRKGLMFEALQPVIDHGFTVMHLNRIEAFIDPENVASIQLIKKMGFQEEGCLRQHYRQGATIYDSLVFSLLQSDIRP